MTRLTHEQMIRLTPGDLLVSTRDPKRPVFYFVTRHRTRPGRIQLVSEDGLVHAGRDMAAVLPTLHAVRLRNDPSTHR
jgi:hypothetical protein